MKLRNRKTGEIVDGMTVIFGAGPSHEGFSIQKFCEEWEDVPEEPKEYWYLDLDGKVFNSNDENSITEDMQQIGNYFETKEEAEKAVEKLKALKRLKNKIGIRSAHYQMFTDGTVCVYFKTQAKVLTPYEKDLDLLFCTEATK